MGRISEFLKSAMHTMFFDDSTGLIQSSAFFNDVTYVSPKVPTLYTVLSTGPNATDPTIYGSNTNAFVLAQNEVVEIVLNNDDPGKHPFHLHGHVFQVVTRSADDAGFYDPGNAPDPHPTPMRRDTILVRPNGHIVLRFRSDNPGKSTFEYGDMRSRASIGGVAGLQMTGD